MKNKRNYLLEATFTTSLLLLFVLFIKMLISKKTERPESTRNEATQLNNVHAAEPESQDDILPVKLGARRVMLQLNTFLPQIHLTLISVLQGLALGVLIARLEKAPPTSISTMLLYFDSLMIVVLIWHLYSSVFVVFLWPLSLWHTLLQFLLAAAQSVTFFYITQPAVWTLGCACMALIAAVIRYLNTKAVGPFNYECEKVYELDMQIEKSGARMFFLASITVGIIGALQAYLPSPMFTIGVGFVVLVAILILSWVSNVTNKRLIDMHFDNSPWAFYKYQVVKKEAINGMSSREDEDAT